MLALFAAIIVPIFLCIYMPFRWLTSQEWPWLRRALYFPIAGQARWEHATQRMRLLRRLGGVPVLLRTADERTVHAVWIEYRSPGAKHPDRAHSATDEGPCATPVALCLHANAMVLDDMIDWAQFYLTRGISVMLVTFWGYPDPDEPEADGRASPPTAAPDVERVKQLPREMEAAYSADVGMRCPSEQTMYHDAEAALRWLMDTRGATIDRTLVHGLSIGGGVAASLGVNHPGLRVTFDQTFASLAEVTLHVGTGLYEQIVLPRAPRRCHTLVRWLRPCVLRLVAFVLLRMLFKTGSSSSRIGEQDRMDNVRKAAAIKADVFAIFAEQDEMMPPTIAHRLLVARYGASAAPDMIHSRQLCVPGGHCAFFADTPEHAHKYTQVRTYPLNSGAARRAPRHTSSLLEAS
jgi:dienelactone hydrolase